MEILKLYFIGFLFIYNLLFKSIYYQLLLYQYSLNTIISKINYKMNKKKIKLIPSNDWEFYTDEVLAGDNTIRLIQYYQILI